MSKIIVTNGRNHKPGALPIQEKVYLKKFGYFNIGRTCIITVLHHTFQRKNQHENGVKIRSNARRN